MLMKRTINEIMEERNEWSARVFPDATQFSSLVKLRGETDELQRELGFSFDRNAVGEEIADCIMCLFDIGMRCGMSVDAINNHLSVKMEKNRARSWKKKY